MKKLVATTLVTGVVVVLAGCQYPNGQPNNTGTGALIGGGVGAASGALIAHRNPAVGALVGGGLGAITGALIGNSMDQQQRERLHQQAPQTYTRLEQGQPLTTADVKALAKAGVSDDVIIAQIQNSHTAFRLSTADVIDLHQGGVSDKVVDCMINTASSLNATPTPTAVETAPPSSQPEAVVAAPGPDYAWVDGEWEWNGADWIWVGGHWVLPPYPHAVWVSGHWYRGPHGWYHSPGHWRP